MIRALVALSVRFRALVVGVAVILAGLGAAQLRGASVEPYPEFAPPQVQIQTEALGLSAAEVEQLVTVPLERDLLNGTSWLDKIQSESVAGLSQIDLTFEPGTDILKARQLVQEHLTVVRGLPNFLSPPVMIQPLSSTSRVMMIGLSARDLSALDLSILARWKVRPKLMGVPGVANVAIWGQRDRQLQVQVNPDQLRKKGVTLDQVIATAGNAMYVSPLTFVQASTPGTGGFIDTSTQRFEIQHVLPITTAKDLSLVTVEGSNGTLRLSDVATVVEDHQPLIGDAVLTSGTGSGLMLVIERFPNANTRDVTKGVEDALEALRPGLSGVVIDTNVYRAESFTDSALHNLGVWGIAGAVLLLLLLALVLFSWRMALISYAAILASLVAAAYVLYLRGTSFNIMILAGLAVALSLVIDDAVCVLGDVRRRLREHRVSSDATPMSAVIAEISSAVRGPLMYATLMVLLAPLPLLFLDGVAGSFATPAIVSYVVAVTVATAVALTLTPALAYLVLGGEPLRPRSSPLVTLAQWAFDRVVPAYVRRPRWAYATVAVLVATACAAIPQVDGRSVLPAYRDSNVLIHWSVAPGTSLPEMARITTAAATELRAIAGVRDVGAHVGRAVTSDSMANVDSGEMWVSLTESAPYDATVASIARVLNGYPGVRIDMQSYPQDQVRAVQSGLSDAVVVRVYGQDFNVLRAKAEQLKQVISSVDGVVRPAVQSQVEAPTLEVEVNLDAALRYGLKPGDVRRQTATYFSGLPVGSLYQEQKIFDVVVTGAPAIRANPANVANLLIDAPTGGQVRVGDVATVRIAPDPTVIRHDATSRSLDVTAAVSGRDVGAVVNDVKDRVRAVQMPLEYHAEVISDAASQQNHDRRTAALVFGTVLGVFLLLQAAFRSWRLAALALLMLPLAGAGGVIAAYAVGGIMSLGALIGFFAVLGIATRNIVLLFRDYQRLESTHGVTRNAELIIGATRDRAGSVLLTVAAAAAALGPVAIFGDTAGTEILQQVAAVALGGLATSTLLTVFVVPALYLRFSATAPPAWTDPAEAAG